MYPTKAEILSKYVRTPEGRNKIAGSMMHPVTLALNYLEQTHKSWEDLDYVTEGHVREYRWFLEVVPEEEQVAEPFPELKALVERLQLWIDRVKARSR